MPKPLFDAPKAYAWEWEDGALSSWADKSPAAFRFSKPSRGAKKRAVRIVRESDYRAMLHAVRFCNNVVGDDDA